MERSVLGPEFKGGIWHRFFMAADKKDETLRSILDEKTRFYKLYYPFLEKKQIIGKAYEELGIPHICGDVNRKELYKLFLQERKKKHFAGKKSGKSRDNSQKYPTILIKENNSRKKSTFKSVALHSKVKQTHVKISNVQSSIEKSTHDLAFDKLLFESPNPGKSNMKDGTVQSKQPKSVRFNDGIEIHRVSPAQPIYKLKPVGRLFDEPSSVRTLNTQPKHHQEVQEDMIDSDSEFDADTGIISDTEDYDLQDSPQTEQVPVQEQVSQNSEVIGHINAEEICLRNSKTSTIYNSSEEEFSSTDSDTAKEGNSLILSSKMITVAQGKWVRKAEQIIVNRNSTKKFENLNMPEDEMTYQHYEMGRNEIHINRNDSVDEYMLEMIKCLKISNFPEYENTTSEDSGSNELIINKIRKEKLMTGNVTLDIRKKIDNNDTTCMNSSVISDKIPIYRKSENSKFSLDKKLSSEELINVDTDQFSYDLNEEINNSNIHNENKTEKEIKEKSDKLFLDKNSLINSTNSTNGNVIKPKPIKKIKIATKKKSIHNPECDVSEGLYSKNHSLNDKNSHTEEKDSLQSVSNAVTQPEQPCRERSHMPDDIKPNTEPSFENKMKAVTQFIGITEKLKDTGSFTAQNLIYLDTSLTIKNEDLKEKELEIIQMSPTTIKSTENIQSTSNLKGICSNIYSFTTSPIKVQSNDSNEDNNQVDHKNGNFATESDLLKDQSKNIPACKVSKYIMNNANNNFESHHEKVDKTDFRNQIMNTNDKKTDEKVLVGENKPLLKHNYNEVMQGKSFVEPQSFRGSFITMTLMNNSKAAAIGPHSRHSVYEDDNDTFQAFITKQNLQCDETENKELEAADFYQGTIAIKSEPESLDYLSKIHMWSLYSKDYTENLSIPSEVTSTKATYNTDLSQREITQGSEKDTKDSCHQNCELETHLTSKENEFSRFDDKQLNVGESSSESVSKINVGTESSLGTVTPIKTQHDDSEAVSTAYETDPETGKLRMNHYFAPMAGSTPVRKPKGMYKEHFFEYKLDEKNNSSGEPDSNISFDHVNKNPNKRYIRENEDNSSSFKVETKNNELSYAFDTEGALQSETLGHSQNNHNSEYLLPNVNMNISITSQDLKNTEMSVKTNKKGIKSLEAHIATKRYDSDNVTHSLSEKYFKDFGSTSKSTAHTSYHQDDNNNSQMSERIIKSSDSDAAGKLKNERIIKKLEPVIYSNIQDESNKTDNKNLIENSGSMICNKIINENYIENATVISETATSNTEQTVCSNKTNTESITQNNDTTFNAKDQNIYPNKTSSQNIAHDSTTSEFITGKYVHISSAIGKFSSKNTHQDQCNNLSSKSILENSNPNSSCDFTAKKYTQNLSAFSDQIICNQLKSDYEINGKPTKGYGFKNIDTIKTMPLSPNVMEEQINSPLPKNSSQFSTRDNDYSELKKLETLPQKTLENKTIHFFVKCNVTSIIKNSSLQETCDESEGFAVPQVMNPCPNNENVQSTNPQNNLNTTSNDIISFVPATVKNKNYHDTKHGQSIDRSSKFQDLKHFMNSDYTGAGVLTSDQENQALYSATSKIVQQKYYKRIKSDSSSLKRKHRTSYDSNNKYNNSLFSEDENLELEKNVSPISSTSVQSTGSHNAESSAATDTGFLKINLKKVNTNIRKKRAKLIKQKPMKIDSTSSEDDVKISPLPLKRKRFGINIQSVDNSHDLQTVVNLLKESATAGCNNVEEKCAQQKMRDGLTDEEEGRVSTIFSVSFENEAAHNRSGLKVSNKAPASEDMNINEHQEVELYQSLEITEQNQDHKKYGDKKVTSSFLSPQANFLFADDQECRNRSFVYNSANKISQIEKKEKISDSQKNEAATYPKKSLSIYKKSHLSNQLLIGLPLSEKTTLNDSLMKQPEYDVSPKNCNSKNYSSDFSDSSSSMIGPSPNTDWGQQNKVHKADVTASIVNETKSQKSYLSQKDISKTTNTRKGIYDKPKELVNLMKSKRMREKDISYSDKLASQCKTSESAHNNSYRDNITDEEEENHGSKRNNKGRCGSGNQTSRTPLRILIDRSSNEVHGNKAMTIEAGAKENSPFRRKFKNTKSSVVSWKGTNETDGIANSPEVRTLLRRTYFMGNKH